MSNGKWITVRDALKRRREEKSTRVIIVNRRPTSPGLSPLPQRKKREPKAKKCTDSILGKKRDHPGRNQPQYGIANSMAVDLTGGNLHPYRKRKASSEFVDLPSYTIASPDLAPLPKTRQRSTKEQASNKKSNDDDEVPKERILSDDGLPKASKPSSSSDDTKRSSNISYSPATKSSPMMKSSSSPSSLEPSPKRQKTVGDDDAVVDSLVCPIALDLPIDPVTAKDGHVYERSSIEDYFEGGTEEDDDDIASPVTGAMITKELVPTPWITSHVEALIKSGVIAGDVADKWLEKTKARQQKKEMEKLLNEANQGNDVQKMELVGSKYQEGNDGFPQDTKEAFFWFDKARQAGSIVGMAEVGYMLISGSGGLTKNETCGIMYLTRAADNGSIFAAYILGMALSEGKFGLPVDKKDAKHWLEKSLDNSSSFDVLCKESKSKARKMLDEIDSELN